MIEKLFDKAPCGFFSFNDDGTVFLTNETLCALLGYNKEELDGINIEKILTLPSRIFYQTHFFPLIKMQEHAEEIFLSLLTKNGQYLPVLLNASRSQLEGRYITSCAFIIVPQRKKFEDELVAARKLAEKALAENSDLLKAKASLQHHAEQLDTQIRIVNKQNQEFKQMNHVVTHNLKEPLRKILMYSARMQNKPSTTDLEKLVRASEQLKAVVFGLQEYVWLDEKRSHFTSINLNSALDSAVEQLHSLVDHSKLILHTDALPTIEGDPEQLQLLFFHILMNAVKFKKKEAAEVRISCTILKHNSFKTVTEKYKYEDFIKLEIRDEGEGFDPAFKEIIFDLFRKVSYVQGQGIGLALCRRVVENHFGWIEAESKINEFTIIRVWLPLKQS